MPWRLQAMKDVAACEKLRGVGKRALIRRYPNGETRRTLQAHGALERVLQKTEDRGQKTDDCGEAKPHAVDLCSVIDPASCGASRVFEACVILV